LRTPSTAPGRDPVDRISAAPDYHVEVDDHYYSKVHEELKRRGVTLMILWEEHRTEHVDGHGYSRFCELYELNGAVRDCVTKINAKVMKHCSPSSRPATGSGGDRTS
jgi:hypothetical protein